MIIDGNSVASQTQQLGSDIVIVGAGTVGLFIAQQMASAGVSTIVVDAGGAVPVMLEDGGGARSTGLHHDGATRGRAFGVGGTSAFWGGQLDEFVDVDLQRNGNEWPLSHRVLRQWYDRAYALLDLPTRQEPEQYQRLLGVAPLNDACIEQYFTSWLPQPNFAALYRKELKQSQLLRVILNAVATDIEFDGAHGKTLRVITSSGAGLEITGNVFIFAAGTVANAKFFLSTKHKSNVPWKNCPHVGAFFHDHFSVRAGGLEMLDYKKFCDYFENGFAGGRKLQPKLRYTQNQRAQAPIGICGQFDFKSSLKQQMGNLKSLVKSVRAGTVHSTIKTLPSDTWAVGRSFFPIVRRLLADRRVAALSDLGTDLIVQSEQIVTGASRIEVLDFASDRYGLLPVGVHWQLDGAEWEHIEHFTMQAGRFLEQNGFARLRRAGDLEKRASAERFRDTFHMAGGLRMSATPDKGVTDHRGLVWDTENVFIAGASLYPTSGYANTTFTALALGARLADHLIERRAQAA